MRGHSAAAHRRKVLGPPCPSSSSKAWGALGGALRRRSGDYMKFLFVERVRPPSASAPKVACTNREQQTGWPPPRHPFRELVRLGASDSLLVDIRGSLGWQSHENDSGAVKGTRRHLHARYHVRLLARGARRVQLRVHRLLLRHANAQRPGEFNSDPCFHQTPPRPLWRVSLQRLLPWMTWVF